MSRLTKRDWPHGYYDGAACKVCHAHGFLRPRYAPDYCWPCYQESVRDAERTQAKWEADMTAEYGPYTPRPCRLALSQARTGERDG